MAPSCNTKWCPVVLWTKSRLCDWEIIGCCCTSGVKLADSLVAFAWGVCWKKAHLFDWRCGGRVVVIFNAFANNDRWRSLRYVLLFTGRPYVKNAYFAWRKISVVKGFQLRNLPQIFILRAGIAEKKVIKVIGQRSRSARPNALFRQRDSHRLTTVRPLSVRRRHAYRSTVYGVDADVFVFTGRRRSCVIFLT